MSHFFYLSYFIYTSINRLHLYIHHYINRPFPMSLSNILQHVKNKGKIPQGKLLADQATEKADTNALRPTYQSREVDPVVLKLKAARKAEKEKKEREQREAKGLPPKKQPSRPQQKTVPKKAPASHATPPPALQRSKPPAKKMNFNQLMMKASKVDTSKLSVNYKAKTKSPDPPKRPITKGSTRETGLKLRPRHNGQDINRKPLSFGAKPASEKPKVATRAPLPVRKPSGVLEEKLKSRRHQDVESAEEDDDMDSFLASDEEEDELRAGDYDRDEIWAMFNKGKKRSYYDKYDDYDSDDMEATGAEIFDEELRSKRSALQEDKREMMEEQRLAELKRKRKQRKE